jgi:hypothetical protein
LYPDLVPPSPEVISTCEFAGAWVIATANAFPCFAPSGAVIEGAEKELDVILFSRTAETLKESGFLTLNEAVHWPAALVVHIACESGTARVTESFAGAP